MGCRSAPFFAFSLGLLAAACGSDSVAPDGGPQTSGGGQSGAASGSVAAGSGSGTGSGSTTSGVSTGKSSGVGDTAASGGVTEGGSAPPPDAGAPPSFADSGVMDPGTKDDGDNTLVPPYKNDPLNTPTAVPQGHQIHFQMTSAQSKIYPGINGAKYTRDVELYIPQQYVSGTPAPFIVVQDGVWTVWLGRNIFTNPNPVAGPNQPGSANLPAILDNLISQNKLPKIVVLFVGNGGGDSVGSERGLEYDTVSGLFAEFVQTEVLPRATMEAKTQLNIDLAFTANPQGRATLGGSSGGAASFSMAWWHPDYFTRVITYSGTYVNQVPASSPFPHGCWVYHDVDPYDATAPNGLIMQHCSGPSPGCDSPLSPAACQAAAGCTWDTTTTKPLRVWLEAGQHDNGAGGGPASYRDFLLANQRMAMSLKLRGYHYHFDYAPSAGHLDGNVVAQTLPGALLWLWSGYPVN
jgi:enterochelin esterase family protein